MYSTRPYQAYSFRCWFSNNPVLAIVVSVLPQDLVSLRSFHSILNFVPEALWCCSLQPIFSFCQDHVLFVLIHLTGVCARCSSSFILSSLASLFNRSVVWICSSLFLFLNGVLSTLFFSMAFFLSFCSTFSRFFGFTRLSKKQLSFTAYLPLPFSLQCHSRSQDEILS